MIRTVLLSASLVAALAHAGIAQTADKQQECQKIGQIATDIMAERKNGRSSAQAERRILRSIPNASKNDEVLAVQLVVWIYGLPQEQLTPEVSNTLYQACLSQ